MTFAENFKRLRNELGLSQAKLSKVTKIPLDTIKSWESGRTIPAEYIQDMVIDRLKSMVAEKILKNL